MSSRVSEIDRLKRKIRRLEEQARRGRQAGQQLAQLRKVYEDVINSLDRTARSVYFLQATVGMPQLYLDRDWRITGYTGDFLLISEQVVELAHERRHLSEFLGEKVFAEIEKYLARVRSLRQLPYDQGEPWLQTYEGPSAEERIGRDWTAFGEDVHWSVEPRDGGAAILHGPHVADDRDCYLVSSREYGDAVTDVRVVCRFRTPDRIELLRDLSLVLSASSGREGTLPDMIGYTVCAASCGNTLARIQKHAADQVSFPERLEPDTEYELTAERTGGRISRRLVRLHDGWEARRLEFMDSSAIYDRQNHIGISTFSGHVSIHSLKIYTRPSRWNIDSFRMRFDLETRLKGDFRPERVFRLRPGPAYDLGEAYQAILFEDITTWRQAEQDLKYSGEYFRSLTENSYEFILTLSAEGTILYGSPSVERQLGFPQGSIIGRKAVEFIHPDDRENIDKVIRRMLEHPDRPVQFETRVRDFQGHWLTVEGISHSMLHDAAVGGIVINARDVTARKKAENALRESEERYRGVVEMMNEGLAVLNETGRVVFVNNAMCAISGYEREDMLGRSPDILLDEAGREEFYKQFELRKQGRSDPYELCILSRDGSRKHVALSPRPLFDEQGRFKGSVVAMRDITGRRQAEEDLKRSRAHMRAVIDGIKNRIIFVNCRMEIILINRAAARAWQIKPEELIGRNFCELWCPNRHECQDCLLRKTLDTGRSHQETRVLPTDNRRVLDIRSDPVYNLEGELLGAVVISEDITSRKRAEELLRRSETRYRLLFENAGNPILLVDHDGELQMLNNLAAGYLGGQPENLVGRSIFEVIPRRYARRGMVSIRRVIENGKLETEDFQLTLHGRRYWFKTIIQPYGFSKGINCAQMILQDVTGLIQAQRELQRERDGLERRVLERTTALRCSEKRLRERLKELTGLYSIRREFDRGGAQEETLMACLAHIRDSLQDPEGKMITLRLDELELNPLGNCLHTGERLECSLSVGGRHRGALIVSFLAGKGKFLPFEQDQLNQAAACLADFIHNRELKDQLLYTEKLAAAGRVAAGVAHEINNPLGAIKNALYVLRGAVPAEHHDYHYLDMMEGEIDRMAAIIVQLYDLYKPSAGESRPIEIKEVLQNVIKMMNTRIRRQKIHMDLDCADGGWKMLLPRDKVIQVLYNIIHNAVQAMPSGGNLSLACRSGEMFNEVSITDTGPGITEDVLPHIFEPFFSTRRDKRMPGEGMGMGLALSRSVMESLGGSISVNTRPGQGATFVLRFPPRNE